MAKHGMRARREAEQRAAHPAPAPTAPPAGARAFGTSPAAALGDAAAPGAASLAAALERSISALDRLADDPAYPAESQQAFVRQARELRRRAALLDAAQFDAGTARYDEAMAALGAVDDALAAAQGQIDQVPAVLTVVTRAAGALDALLGAVT